MNGYREDKLPCCCFHPKQVTIGVCPLCLNERLLILAAKQGHHLSQSADQTHHQDSYRRNQSAKQRIRPSSSIITLPKIFALGSLLHRFESQNKQFDHNSNNYSGASASPEDDSFISMKFEENGVASWEKNKASNKVSLDQYCNNKISNWSNETTNKSIVVDHAKPSGGVLRWRKRIGHLFQLSRWKRSSKASVCHVGSKVEIGVKVRSSSGWIRSLTKRRSKE